MYPSEPNFSLSSSSFIRILPLISSNLSFSNSYFKLLGDRFLDGFKEYVYSRRILRPFGESGFLSDILRISFSRFSFCLLYFCLSIKSIMCWVLWERDLTLEI